jgi:hypothetical protein
MKDPLPFTQAAALAVELLELLRPSCERIEIAGSLRRRKSTVGDLELVAISRAEVITNLLDEPVGERHLIFDRLNEPDPRITDRTLAGVRHRQFKFRGFPVDLFVVAPPTWGVLYTIRTGNAIFSHWVVSQRRIGGGLPDHLFIQDGRLHSRDTGITFDTPEEADVLRQLALPGDLAPDHPIRNARDWAEIRRVLATLKQETH